MELKLCDYNTCVLAKEKGFDIKKTTLLNENNNNEFYASGSISILSGNINIDNNF